MIEQIQRNFWSAAVNELLNIFLRLDFTEASNLSR